MHQLGVADPPLGALFLKHRDQLAELYTLYFSAHPLVASVHAKLAADPEFVAVVARAGVTNLPAMLTRPMERFKAYSRLLKELDRCALDFPLVTEERQCRLYTEPGRGRKDSQCGCGYDLVLAAGRPCVTPTLARGRVPMYAVDARAMAFHSTCSHG